MRKRDWLFFAPFALVKLLIHLSTHQGYGYFRDEFYYLACARHLDFGYVDHPPFSIALLSLVRALFGESLLALRLWPALAGAAMVWICGLIARDLGGGRWAQAIAMVAALAAPAYLALGHFYSMNAFELLFWALAAWLLTKALASGQTSDWAWLGLVLGLGLLNKISVLWLGFGLAVGLLLTPQRRQLLKPGPWLAAGLALVLFLPYLIWQVIHGWPTLEFIEQATSVKMAPKSVVSLFSEQILFINPASFPVWLIGLGFLLFSPKVRQFRLLGWMYLSIFLLLALSGTSRAGYLAPAYIWLLAAGAVAVTGWIQAGWARGSIVAVLALSGAALAPLALPVLSVPSYVSYSSWLGIQPRTEERKELANLPQFFADMHGWNQIAGSAEQVVGQLSEEEKAKVTILAPNYGVAGALQHLAPHLPPVVSGHNNYWLWGPGQRSGEVMIIFAWDREDLEQIFAEVELAARTDCGYCMPYENQQPIWICRHPSQSLQTFWPSLKNFN